MTHALSIPILVEEHSAIQRVNEPVTVGIPFPKAAVFDPSLLALFDCEGQVVPLQVHALARWVDRSIKWALLDFQANVEANGTAAYRLRSFDSVAILGQLRDMAVERSADSIVVDTGHVTFFVSTHSLKPFSRVVVQGCDIVKEGESRVVLTDTSGSEYDSRITDISVETAGPLRTTLGIQGKLCSSEQTPLANFISRLSFYVGSGLVELTLTLRNPRAARHPGGLWDLGDAGSIYFKDFSIYTALLSDDLLTAEWTTQPSQPPLQTQCSHLEIYQDSSGGPNWNSSNHINRLGKVMNTFPGYRVIADGRTVEVGRRAAPVVSIYDAERIIRAGIEKFWQNSPKALEVAGRGLTIRLFPRQYSDVFELQGGEQKTHTILMYFDRKQCDSMPINWLHDRLFPRIPLEWYSTSKALHYLTSHNHLHKRSQPMILADSLVDNAVNGVNNFFDRRELIDEYGWRNFGDLYADHEAVGHKGTTPLVAHYNNQYDVIYGALIHYLRSGNRRWFHLMDDLAKHVIDIDIYHTEEDRPAFNGGMFWHTEHYTDASTCTHRAYSKVSLEMKSRHLCGGGPSCEHNYTSGLLNYYLLTGNTAARDTVIGLANWVIKLDDGSDSILGIIDKRATGLCSMTASREYHGPGRGCGNSINSLLDAYILTHDRSYVSKAEELIRRCIHPNDDIQQRRLDDIEYKWSYIIFLQTIGKYLDFKLDEGEIDYMYSYARASLLHYAKWMQDHEVPYKLVLDRVNIPTETWPAQDIRKSNIFKFAAKHADDLTRSKCLEKSEFFFNACINDLLSFETCTLTRPIVLLMTNGFMHDYFQIHPDERAPHPNEHYDFGKPQKFKPQLYELYKARDSLITMMQTVKQAAQRVGGLLRNRQSPVGE
jgi:hypothetical protein